MLAATHGDTRKDRMYFGKIPVMVDKIQQCNISSEEKEKNKDNNRAQIRGIPET